MKNIFDYSTKNGRIIWNKLLDCIFRLRANMIIGDRYNVVQEKGETENSKTYLCKDIVRSSFVFIKQLKVNLIGQIIACELFRREYKALSILNHDNIINYIDSFIDDEKPCIVTEFFDAQSLSSFLNKESLSETQKYDIILKILDGLIYAHDQKVIHRDIKPQNILINECYDVKIIDFGISKIIGSIYNPDDTVKDYMSIRYASPEQLQRFEANIGSDLFSLGLLIAYIFIEKEPPENRSELKNYLGLITDTNLFELLETLTNSDINKRPKSAYYVKKEINKLKLITMKNTSKFFIKASLKAKHRLYEIGIVSSYYNNYEIKAAIIKDTENYLAYKHNDTYFFIGRTLKYICKIDQSKMFFHIVDINFIDNQILWEEELKNGINLNIPFEIIDNQHCEKSDILQVIQIMTEFEKSKSVKKKDSLSNPLIKKWSELLTLIDKKKNIGGYTEYYIDEKDYQLRVKVNSITYKLDYNELIQLSLLEDKQQKTIGRFEDYNEDGYLIINIDDPEINFNEISQNGKISIDTTQEKANLRRFAYALNQIKYNNAPNRNILNVINDPSITDMNEIVPIDNFFQNEFNNSELSSANAIKKALATKDIFILQGPPGTGKTTVIVEIICQLLRKEPESKILLTSQSHTAVDHAFNKLSKILGEKCIIRIGRIEKIAKSSEEFLYDNKLDEWVNQVKEDSLINLKNHLKSLNYNFNSNEINDIIYNLSEEEIFDKKIDEETVRLLNILKQWHKCLGKLDEFNELFADKASVVASTCMGIAARNQLNDIIYDWVIIDEAARATPLETLVPIVKGKKIILVGDHKQLPPIIKTNLQKEKLKEKGLRKSDLEKSLFEELIMKIPNNAKARLSEQFRMHPYISNMISKVFYPEEEIITNIKPEDRMHKLKWGSKSVIWIDTKDLKCNLEKDSGFSKKNETEADLILHVVENIERTYKENCIKEKVSVGIISGYNAQTSLLRSLIYPDNLKWENVTIKIDNVDAFQGSEVDLVIYSVVRNNQRNEIGFLSDTRRLNVALSRGRNCLIIVGNLEFAKSAEGLFGNPFKQVINYLNNHQSECYVEAANEEFRY